MVGLWKSEKLLSINIKGTNKNLRIIDSIINFENSYYDMLIFHINFIRASTFRAGEFRPSYIPDQADILCNMI